MAKTKNDDFKLPDPDSTPKSKTPTFQFLNPLGDEIFEVGSKVAIYWKGGPHYPQKVKISLVDVQPWAFIAPVIDYYVNTANPGLFQWIIPVSFPLDHTHTYLFYIQDVPGTTWAYGQPFKIT
jgi:hypothetical protein